MDALDGAHPLRRLRGDKTKNAHGWTDEQSGWIAKFGYLLVATDAKVLPTEVLASLPSVEEVIRDCVTCDAGTACNPFHLGIMCCNVFVIIAAACEKLDQPELVLLYTAAALETDLGKLGTHVPTSRVLALVLQGRALSALRRTTEAAASLEAAAEEARTCGLWLFETLALRDLKLLVLDQIGHGEHGARRLGAVLRLLKGPAELLSPMMDGLDAAELMSLPAPEAGYTVLYETEGAAMLPASGVSESASELAEGVPPERAAHVAAKGPAVTGHSQLSGLKLSALKRRAREVGVREGALEEADDADDIKAVVIALILKEEQQAPA